MRNHSPAQVNAGYLWYPGNPDYPILVGDLNLVMPARGASLKQRQALL
jgi:hypothetical protein